MGGNSSQPRFLLSATLDLASEFSQYPDEVLAEKWKTWAFSINRQQQTLRDILPSALAAVREAASRAAGLSAFPCQIEAAIALTEPAITEVGTGEGKTLVTAMAACLFALHRRGVHVATVNSYLAERDFEFATPVAARLGLTVGLIKREQTPTEKKAAYECDITYGTGYDFGFDYLRDQLELLRHAKGGPTLRLRNLLLGRPHAEPATVQRALAYAIVDEIDSVLIDEASSPLIISQPAPASNMPGEVYALADTLAGELRPEIDYTLDARGKNARLTEEGRSVIAEYPGIPWDTLVRPWHVYVTNALNARHSFRAGEQYVVLKGKVVIVDEFTGRAHEERSWQQGLHQAVAARERLEIPPENQTAASITRQRYFGLYRQMCGLTGTGWESRREFGHFFRLPVRRIAPNRPSIRISYPDRIYRDAQSMLQAVAGEIRRVNETQRPILVGTRTVRLSEELSALLSGLGLAHRVLNARQDREENDIVARAGEPGSIVVATNMAGRGTHISLPAKSIALGGLLVIGVERSESSRVDRQLAGRAARQGQPGGALFFCSTDDHLIRSFAPHTAALLAKLPADADGRLPDHAARFFTMVQRKVQTIRYRQRLQLERRDKWMDQTRRSLA